MGIAGGIIVAELLQASGPVFCVVCNEELHGPHRSTCQMCGGPFHQPWTPDSDAPRCGQAASHDETLAVVFLCQDCYRNRRRPLFQS